MAASWLRALADWLAALVCLQLNPALAYFGGVGFGDSLVTIGIGNSLQSVGAVLNGIGGNEAPVTRLCQ